MVLAVISGNNDDNDNNNNSDNNDDDNDNNNNDNDNNKNKKVSGRLHMWPPSALMYTYIRITCMIEYRLTNWICE